MNTQSILWKGLALALSTPLVAQIGGDGRDGVFHPKSNTVIDTTNHPGGFDYQSITIPAGVTVALIGSNPAILRSRDGVNIAGTLHANGSPGKVPTGGAPGAGGYAGGNGGIGSGKRGAGPGGGAGGITPFGKTFASGDPGKHRSVYGSAHPFDLRGGSGAGGSAYSWSSQMGAGPGGGGGGGVIVLLTDGEVKIGGKLSANGSGTAAGGSLMVRALQGMQISGRVETSSRGLWGPVYNGFIRLDNYGSAPTITGKVQPAPIATASPMLRQSAAPAIGRNWRLSVATLPGDTVQFYAAARSIRVSLPTLGVLRIDPATMLHLGGVKASSQGHDPIAALALPVPNDATLRGMRLHVQALNASTTVPAGPRLSNALSVRIQ